MKAWICEDLETGDASIVEAEAWDEARAAYVLGVTGANARALAPQQRERVYNPVVRCTDTERSSLNPLTLGTERVSRETRSAVR